MGNSPSALHAAAERLDAEKLATAIASVEKDSGDIDVPDSEGRSSLQIAAGPAHARAQTHKHTHTHTHTAVDFPRSTNTVLAS